MEQIQRSLGRIESTVDDSRSRIILLEQKVDRLRIERAKISGVQYLVISLLGIAASFLGEFLRH